MINKLSIKEIIGLINIIIEYQKKKFMIIV